MGTDLRAVVDLVTNGAHPTGSTYARVELKAR